MNKISLFCDRVIEACWLAALVIAPLFININSTVPFELNKSTLVRSIALVMLAAFIAGRLLRTRPDSQTRPIYRHPLFVITLLLGLSYLVSAALSVLPSGSWWGTDVRGQGAYTLIGYFIIFTTTVLTLKDREQLERIFVTIILTSIPIVLYGFVQKFKLEVFNWDFSIRIASTMGNPIFLGSYLLMVIPLTAYLLIRSFRESSLRIPKAIFYIILLLAQVACLFLTESRGPLMGLIIEVLFFAALSGLVFRKILLALGSYIIVVLIMLFFLSLALPNTPFQGLKVKVGRLGQMLEAREGAAQVRFFIWEGVVKMVQSDSYRAVVGYGPETMFVPYFKYCPAKLVTSEGNKITFPDRSHNEFFDTVITNGLIGALLYLLLFGAMVFYAFKAMGLLANRMILIGLLLAFGLAGLLIPIALGKTIFIAVGVPLGMVFGAATHLFWRTIVGSWKQNENSEFGIGNSELLVIALFSALIGHFVEIQFGIDLTASRTYFYIYLAILIAIIVNGLPGGQKSDQPASSVMHPEPLDSSKPAFSALAGALVVTFVLCTLVFNFLATPLLQESAEKTMRAVTMIIITWLSSAILFYLLTRIFILSSLVSAMLAFIYALIIISFLPPDYKPTVVITLFYLGLFVNILVLAWALARQSPLQRVEARPTELGGENPNPASPFKIFSSIMIALIVLLVIMQTNLNLIKGDLIYKVGSGQEGEKNWEGALFHYEEAMAFSPKKNTYCGESARMCLEKYYAEKDQQKRKYWYDRCLGYLDRSIKYNPMDPTRQANMGRFYRVQGRESKDPAKRIENFNLAIKYYENACELSPQHPALRNEVGEVYHEMGRYEEAVKQYEKSLVIAPDFSETYSHIGDAYLEKSNKPGGSDTDKDSAVKNYYEAVKIQARMMPDLRDPNQEVMFERANVTVIKHYPQDYRAYYNLGRYYAQKGKPREATEIFTKALSLADEKTQSVIKELLEKLRKNK